LLAREDRVGTTPQFHVLDYDAPVPIGLSITPNGWYGMDYPILEAHVTACNRLCFSAKFGTDGRLYVLFQLNPRTVGESAVQRWIQLGVNIGRSRVEANEGIVSVTGKIMKDGWQSFDISLNRVVNDTFGKQGFVYGEHGKLLTIRLRGSMSISPIRLCRSVDALS
jgi:hypothetical protein